MQRAETLAMPDNLEDGWDDGGAVVDRCGDRFLHALSFLLMGYALFGHGVAYLGVPPIFVGELLLGAGLLMLLRTHGWSAIFDMLPTVLLTLLVVWGGICTLPHISKYGALAMRDAVVWGYALWAIVVGGLVVARPQRLRLLIDNFRRFVPIFIVAAPILWVADNVLRDYIPRLPVSNARMLSVKAGDTLVHAAAIAAFFAVDLARNASLVSAMLLSLIVVLCGRSNRGGLLSFFVAFMVVNVFRPAHRWSMAVVGSLAFMLIMFVLVGASISIGQRRDISADQLLKNVTSVFGASQDSRLENTKQWRLNWWGDIIGYTFDGEHFWMGKGFGVNLADDDGYQVRADGSLRSPHNVHMNFLARSGVPGFALWVLLQLAWACSVGSALFRSIEERQRTWSSLFIFLVAYWTALMVNATFDVFLEGPMGGVWFWSVFGLGLAAVWIHREHPEVLDDLDAETDAE
ncbi:MAG: O-antigen ligase family protein [Tepidisphaeraceae bacterium]